MRIPPAVLALLCAGAAGCDPAPDSNPPVTTFSPDDREMTQAMEKARSELPVFVRQLKAPGPKRKQFDESLPFRFD